MSDIKTQAEQDEQDDFYGVLLALTIGIVLAVVLAEWAMV